MSTMPDPLLHPSVYGAYFRQRLWERDGGICQLCGDPVELRVIHIDHIKPRCVGGPDTWDNLQATHKACNLKKGADRQGSPKRTIAVICKQCGASFQGVQFVAAYCSDPCRKEARRAYSRAYQRAKYDRARRMHPPKRRHPAQGEAPE